VRCRKTSIWGTALTLLLVVAWPSLSLPAGVFSKGYFTFWTIISIIWGLVATVVTLVLPISESWAGISACIKNMLTGTKPTPELADVDESSKHAAEKVKAVEVV
jgi:urea-proton symporter